MFNQPINNKLPNSLTSLTFGENFNQTIDLSNTNLTTLTFGNHFNNDISANVLPNSLETLTFGDNFNKKILPGILPNSLKNLSFGSNYNHFILAASLPSSLKTFSCKGKLTDKFEFFDVIIRKYQFLRDLNLDELKTY